MFTDFYAFNRMALLAIMNFIVCSALLVSSGVSLFAESYVMRGDTPLYTEFLDPTAPFLETTLDLRATGPKGDLDNLAPRAIVLPLGGDLFVGFDTELLRVAAIWKGDSLSPDSLAFRSYGKPRDKAPGGQDKLVRPAGNIALSTGLYPGWLDGSSSVFADPRSRWVDESELGRGPLDSDVGRWSGIEDFGSFVTLRYSLRGSQVKERFRVESSSFGTVVERWIQIDQSPGDLILALADFGKSVEQARRVAHASVGVSLRDDRYLVANGFVGDGSIERVVRYRLLDDGSLDSIEVVDERSGAWDEMEEKLAARWPVEETMAFGSVIEQGSYATQQLDIAYPNIWKRRIRPVDIVFGEDENAYLLTFDGDVYRVAGISGESSKWRRIAAGFNEPQSLEIRNGELFVFSRLGITRLVDRDGDEETDFYEMFCNGFTQSAETRDMPMSLTALEDGSFLICKGGQQVNTISPHSGRVLRIASDGKKVDVYATGIRNGYLERNTRTGLLTSSDQQGNWVPSTPFHIIKSGSYYGFEPSLDTETSVSEPALWIPHRVSQSGISQVWAFDQRLGSLSGSMIWIDYQGPRLLEILLNEDDIESQAAVLPLPIDFEVPLLNGAINPVDGKLYLVGFQIWGTNAVRYEGLTRLSSVKSIDALPQVAKGFKEGVLLRFSEPLDGSVALNVGSYEAKSWEYKRTGAYGSAQYKSDGSFGEDKWTIHSVMLSADRKSVFLAIENLQPTMQFALEYNLYDEWESVYFTFKKLGSFDAEREGFGAVDFAQVFASPLSERTAGRLTSVISADRGHEIYKQFACLGCHSIDGSTEGKIGPTFKDLYWKERLLDDGSTTIADDLYLRWSMMRPEFQVVNGYGGDDASMPSYRGILSLDDVASVILFIRSLSEDR